MESYFLKVDMLETGSVSSPHSGTCKMEKGDHVIWTMINFFTKFTKVKVS